MNKSHQGYSFLGKKKTISSSHSVETTYLSFFAANLGDAKHYPFSRHVGFQVTFSFILEHPRPWSLLFYVTLRKTK
jgi:hypothetical protein